VNSVASDECVKTNSDNIVIAKMNKIGSPPVEKIEFSKNYNRKFSPDVDLNGIIIEKSN